MLRPDEVIMVKEEIQNEERQRNPKYCFSWSNYKGHMMDQMGELLREEKFVDVTIFCENRFFKAHKIVLCGASPFLKTLLEGSQCKHPSITLANIAWTHLTWILQFIYSGQVSVPEEQFTEFLNTAKLLQISTLCKKTSKSCISRLTHPLEPPAKKPRLAEQTPPTPGEADQQSPLPVFYRTQAVMQELQQNANAALAQQEAQQEIVVGEQNTTEHHLEVQAEEIIEIESTTEQQAGFNPHDSYCIPGGVPTPTSHSPGKQGFIFESYHSSTIKSTHSLAPKTCNMCGKIYSNLSNLRQHVNLVHTTQKSVQCPLCGKLFKSDLYMRRHLICSHNVTPMKKDTNWRDKKSETQQSSSGMEQQNVQQQIWSEMNAAVANLAQNIQTNG